MPNLTLLQFEEWLTAAVPNWLADQKEWPPPRIEVDAIVEAISAKAEDLVD